ncbi:PQ loop repeat-domain-containing protein [Lasiosphaeria ovina]|uniref:PQ loop repeat-domain-containing protein n=1 Tax=Lasiosphaeria ovina TaxID=92902 RepID=A0AAE0MZD0_9PEZI|nr:PQ loop repeat-domain-containing protein [Lasiosphaeria ovina]
MDFLIAAGGRAPAALASPDAGEALSGVFGSVSLTAWICLLLPQLIANYKAKSADALSMKFLVIWLLGDLSNLLGATWTNIAPSTVALACYFCFADMILIAQCTYYNNLNARRRSRTQRRRGSSTATEVTDATAVEDAEEDEHEAGHGHGAASENDPLINRRSGHHHRRRSESLGLPGSHRRHSMRRSESNLDPLTRIITGEDDTPDSNPWLHNALSLLAVWVVGGAGWFIGYKMGAWDVADGLPDSGAGDVPTAAKPTAVIGLALGYFSAVCYLCARIPQIIKNYQEKSCEGLALLFFLLSLTGNFTYGASVLSYSQDRAYVLRALPWLLGSLGTIVEDLIIFAQFRLYSPGRQAKTNDLA